MCRLLQTKSRSIVRFFGLCDSSADSADVAACIEHSNATKMCDLCRDKDKIVVDVEELKTNDLLVLGNRGLTCISESGLYRILHTWRIG